MDDKETPKLFLVECGDCGETGWVSGACEYQEFLGGHGPGMCAREREA